MKKCFWLFLSVLIILGGCREDSETSVTSYTTFPPPSVSVLADVVGSVVNENGEAIEGVEVKMGDEVYTTDAYGLFVMKNTTLFGTGTFITASKDGYFPGSRKFYPSANSRNFITIELLEKELTASFPSTSGGLVSTSDGATVNFPANSIIREDGSVYNGTVNAYVKWLDPTSIETFNQMPGSLEGIDDEENAVVLGTFGMIAVELSSPSGQALNVNSSAPATIDLPVPTELLANAPTTIPLWYFDEAVASWVEEGEAVLQNGRYVGLVDHFSFWNCDAPFPLIDFLATVQYDGVPTSGVYMKITILSSGWCGGGVTDTSGIVGGKIAKDELLLMELFDDCGNAFYSQQIGPFSVNTNIGVVNVVSPNVNMITVTGSLEDCNQDPISNGMAVVESSNGNAYAMADANGDFSLTTISCSPDPIDVFGVNFDDYTTSSTTNFPFSSTINVGTINVCGNTLTEYFIIEIDGDERLYLDIYGGADSSGYTNIQITTVDSAYLDMNLGNDMVGTVADSDIFVYYYDYNLSPNYSIECTQCGFLQFEFTEYGAIGQDVKGFFSGNIMMFEDFQTTVIKPVTGSFSFVRDY